MSERPSWMPSDAAMDKARVEAAMLRETFGQESDDNEPIRALIQEAVRAHDHERFRQYLLDTRGIDGEPCSECGGVGVKAYGDTATWHGGIGGQMITNAICDKCWGSGDPDRPWVNLRSLVADHEQAISAAVEKALAEQQKEWISALKDVNGERICHRDFREMWDKAEGSPTYWAELLRLSMESIRNQEARHRREVIEAEVGRYESVLRGLRSEEQTPQVRAIIESVDADADRYRAELAALGNPLPPYATDEAERAADAATPGDET